jgi:hypothetical protein
MSEDPRTPGFNEPVAPNTLGNAAPPNTLGAAPPPVASAPPGAPPPDGPPGWSAAPPERPRRSGRARLIGFLGIVLVVVIAVGVRFAVGSAVRGIADQLAVAGTPMGRISGDDRHAYSDRLEKALGERAKGLSDADAAALFERVERQGMPLLDDAALIDHLQIQTAAIGAVDEASCAAFGRASLAGTQASDDVQKKIVAAIPDDRVKAWIEVSVRAVERGATASSPAPTLDPAATDAAYQALFESLPTADSARVGKVAGDLAGSSDADVCWTIRTVYRGVAALPPDKLAIIARVDVSQ